MEWFLFESADNVSRILPLYSRMSFKQRIKTVRIKVLKPNQTSSNNTDQISSYEIQNHKHIIMNL